MNPTETNRDTNTKGRSLLEAFVQLDIVNESDVNTYGKGGRGLV